MLIFFKLNVQIGSIGFAFYSRLEKASKEYHKKETWHVNRVTTDWHPFLQNE